ncbi:MAG: family 43 glycosylhydrolase [Roseburia sp.]|nr:family 43 glycosylhydrolase [Roseburia sp.]
MEMKERLEQAIRRVDLDEVQKLLTENPAAIDFKTRDEVPFALLAAQMGDLPLTKYIVEYSRASMNLRDNHYRSILHYAVLSKKPDTIPYLVERVGMSALDGDLDLVTPWDIAHRLRLTEINDYFARYYQAPYEDTYHNPIRTGMYPDPSIVRVGDDFYMANSSFIFFPCIPISHSRDLIHWEIIGHAITNPAWADIDDLEGGRGYWAPDISYKNGRFYVTATYRMNDTGSVIRRQIVVSSDKPEGPYSEPFYIEEDGIDPSLFHDDDGRSYMLLNRGARILEIDSEKGTQLSPATLLFYGDQKRAPEGPHLLKKDGWYYLFEAEGGTGPGHRITVSRSRELMGIYEPCPYNPIMRQWIPEAPLQRCGHGKPVMTPDGDWYMVYLCGRMINGKYSMLGRETALDPITWTADEWPIVNRLQGPSCQQKKPLLSSVKANDNAQAAQAAAEADDTILCTLGFGRDALSKEFMTPRTPTANGILLNNGVLSLEGSRIDLNSMHAKNIVVRRQTDFVFTCQVTMDCSALTSGQDAGMTCYYDENTYLKFGIFVKNGAYTLAVFEKIDTDEHISFSKDVTEEIMTCMSYGNARITLRIDTDYLRREFSYALADSDCAPERLGVLDNVYYLCDEGIRKGKRFTGAMVGVYAYANDTPVRIEFERFLYKKLITRETF